MCIHMLAWHLCLMTKAFDRLTKAEALDMSPFTVRALKSSSHVHTTPFPEKNEPEDEAKSDDNEKAPSWTIEGMTQRNLEPTITNSELKEYKRYNCISVSLAAKSKTAIL